MAIVVVVALACLLAALQIVVRRRISHNATTFLRTGSDVSSLPALNRWTLAVVAPYLMPLELPVDLFQPPQSRRVPTLKAVLKRDWGIEDRQSLLNVVNHLQQKGHRAYCASVTNKPQECFLAWDLMRVILLVWAGLNLEWISYDEFSSIARTSGIELQRTFPDWESAANSYESGLTIWAREGKVHKVAERGQLTLRALLNDPHSPWKEADWQTPLAATIAR